MTVSKILFWLYLLNAILLINHEIDSAYWKEWELFKLPGGIAAFLILHFPLIHSKTGRRPDKPFRLPLTLKP